MSDLMTRKKAHTLDQYLTVWQGIKEAVATVIVACMLFFLALCMMGIAPTP